LFSPASLFVAELPPLSFAALSLLLPHPVKIIVKASTITSEYLKTLFINVKSPLKILSNSVQSDYTLKNTLNPYF
jgi:hypothetical protein